MIKEASLTEVGSGGFTPKATKFFAGLEGNNSKEYWTANKGLFENEVKEPMAALVESLPERFGPFKIFRMNRDIRFSPDKSPYKTQHGAAHEADGTVYYVHLLLRTPRRMGAHGGVWRIHDGARSVGTVSGGGGSR